MGQQDYYNLLNVEKGASQKRIKEAYRKLAFEYHPDRNMENPEAVDKMKAVNEAYAVLSDRSKRRQYDEMKQRFGSNAHTQFRSSYSEKDIFSGSDIHQIFEELSRSMGMRGFDEIFKEFYGANYRSFQFRNKGMFGNGFLIFGGFSLRGGPGKLLKSLLGKMGNGEPPQKGDDLNDIINLNDAMAKSGGPYAYFHREKSKKLVIKIPPNVRDGQKIRLAGMGGAGKWGGEQGDMYLKVRIKKPILRKIKELIGGSKDG